MLTSNIIYFAVGCYELFLLPRGTRLSDLDPDVIQFCGLHSFHYIQKRTVSELFQFLGYIAIFTHVLDCAF